MAHSRAACEYLRQCLEEVSSCTIFSETPSDFRNRNLDPSHWKVTSNVFRICYYSRCKLIKLILIVSLFFFVADKQFCDADDDWPDQHHKSLESDECVKIQQQRRHQWFEDEQCTGSKSPTNINCRPIEGVSNQTNHKSTVIEQSEMNEVETYSLAHYDASQLQLVPYRTMDPDLRSDKWNDDYHYQQYENRYQRQSLSSSGSEDRNRRPKPRRRRHEEEEDKFVSSISATSCTPATVDTGQAKPNERASQLCPTLVANKGINFEKLANDHVYCESKSPGHIKKPLEHFGADFIKITQIDKIFWKNLDELSIEKLTSIQKYVAGNMLDGRTDLLVSAPTGTGKTMSYLVPLIKMTKEVLVFDRISTRMTETECCSPVALIVLPTRELVLQTHQLICQLAKGCHLRYNYFYGTSSIEVQQQLMRVGIDIIISTPGRLAHLMKLNSIDLRHTRFVVFDEIDKVFQNPINEYRGKKKEYDFGVSTICEQLKMAQPEGQQRHWRYFLFTATVDENIRTFVETFLAPEYVFMVMGDKTKKASNDIKQVIVQVAYDQKRKELVNLLKNIYSTYRKILVFTNTRIMAERISTLLNMSSFCSVPIHSNRPQEHREKVVEDFRAGRVHIIVATHLLARGFHVTDLDCVINFDLPHSIDEYIHCIGRTGRMGNVGIAITFFDAKNMIDLRICKDLIRVLKDSSQQVPQFLLDIQKAN